MFGMEMSTPEHMVASSALHTASAPLSPPNTGKTKRKYGKLPTEAEVHLGKISDATLCETYGVSIACVKARRRKLGIAPYVENSEGSTVPEAAIPLLGTRPDTEIVKEFGVSISAVNRARNKLGIPRYRIEMGTYTKTTQSKSAKLPAEAFDDFGKMSDKEVGLKYGVSTALAAYHRRKRGISAFDLFTAGDHDHPDSGKLSESAVANGAVAIDGPTCAVSHSVPAKNPCDSERTFASLERVFGPTAANLYFELVHQYGLPVLLIAEYRALLAKSPTTYPAIDDQCSHEVAQLRDLIPRLGKSMDAWLAKQFELAPHTVRKLRLHLGITTFDYSGQVPVEEFGKTDDDVLSERYGVPAGVIFTERRKLGIAKVGAKNLQLSMIAHRNPDLIKRLGTATDGDLASEFGIAPHQVYRLREHFGIGRFSPIAKLVGEMPELVARLGSTTDKRLGAEYGLSAGTTAQMRSYLSKGKCRKRRDYSDVSPEIIEMLKTHSVAAASEICGLGTRMLTSIRNAFNIPAFDVGVKFPEEAIAALGTVSDPVIAKRFGINRSVVIRRRISLGIKPFGNAGRRLTGFPVVPGHGDNADIKPLTNAPILLSTEVVEMLGKLTDSALARKTGFSQETIAKHRRARGIAKAPINFDISSFPEAAIPLLGNRPDTEVAATFNVSVWLVGRARRHLGKAAYNIESALPADAIALIGKISDDAIAKQFGFKTHIVRAVRVKRGIKSMTDASKQA
jgi:hypothetical protein